MEPRRSGFQKVSRVLSLKQGNFSGSPGAEIMTNNPQHDLLCQKEDLGS